MPMAAPEAIPAEPMPMPIGPGAGMGGHLGAALALPPALRDQVVLLDEIAHTPQHHLIPKSPTPLHVPIFLHLMSGARGTPVFESAPLNPPMGMTPGDSFLSPIFTFATKYGYYCGLHGRSRLPGPLSCRDAHDDGPRRTRAFAPDAVADGGAGGSVAPDRRPSDRSGYRRQQLSGGRPRTLREFHGRQVGRAPDRQTDRSRTIEQLLVEEWGQIRDALRNSTGGCRVVSPATRHARERSSLRPQCPHLIGHARARMAAGPRSD